MQNSTESQAILHFTGSEEEKKKSDGSFFKKCKMLLLLIYILTEKAVISSRAHVLYLKCILSSGRLMGLNTQK